MHKKSKASAQLGGVIAMQQGTMLCVQQKNLEKKTILENRANTVMTSITRKEGTTPAFRKQKDIRQSCISGIFVFTSTEETSLLKLSI